MGTSSSSPEPPSNFLQDLEKRAAEIQKNFNEPFQAITKSKNTGEINEAIKDGSDVVLKQLSKLSSDLQSALSKADGEAKNALEKSLVAVEKSVQELRHAQSDLEKHDDDLRAQLQAAVQSALKESQKLAKEVTTNVEQANKKLAPKIIEAVDDFVKKAEAVQKDLHEATSKHASKDEEAVNKALKEGTRAVEKQLSALSLSLRSAVGEAKGTAKEVLEQSRKNVEKTAKELHRTQLDLDKYDNKFRDELQSVQGTLKETQKMAMEVTSSVKQKLAPEVKKAFDDFLKHAKDVQKTVHEAVSK